MKLTKTISIITAAFLAVAPAIASVNTISQSVIATTKNSPASIASRHHLVAYTMPARYRGNWRYGKRRLHITKRYIWGTDIGGKGAKTYRMQKKYRMHGPFTNKVLLVSHTSKSLYFCYPSGEGSSIYRKGKGLVVWIDTQQNTYHRY